MATNNTTETANCHRCGRRLTSATSVSRGYGRTCRAKVREAAKVVDLTEYKAFQVAKAEELIEQGGIVPTSRPALFLAVSSDGTARYMVDATEHSCSCPAGDKGRHCYHLLAADVLTAAAPRSRAA
jgi:hypothetical protein